MLVTLNITRLPLVIPMVCRDFVFGLKEIGRREMREERESQEYRIRD
jgi:hypothetical protein